MIKLNYPPCNLWGAEIVIYSNVVGQLTAKRKVAYLNPDSTYTLLAIVRLVSTCGDAPERAETGEKSEETYTSSPFCPSHHIESSNGENMAAL
jgi:hypothetical protein